MRHDLRGTYRDRNPEQTWQIISPLLNSYGITRVADVTDLDFIGIPVFNAVRPTSQTLTVSQGKGVTKELARLSAVMECIEIWHAERDVRPDMVCSAAELHLDYAIADVAHRVLPANLLSQVQQPWRRARYAISNKPTWVPIEAYRLSFSSDYGLRPRLYQTTSTGLASGNTTEEAQLHAIYEVLERHVIASSEALGEVGTAVRLNTIPASYARDIVDTVEQAGVNVEVRFFPNELNLPVFSAFVWSPDYGRLCAGSGCHSDPLVAVSRAVTEAIQTRLTEIGGTRDDLVRGQVGIADTDRPNISITGVDWSIVAQSYASTEGFIRGSLRQELNEVLEHLQQHEIHEPLICDLDTKREFSVVKVFIPGLLYSQRGLIPWERPR